MAVNNQVLQQMVNQANQKSPKSGSGGKVVAVLLTALVIGGGVWAYDNFMVIKVKDQALMEATNKVTELDNQNKNLAEQINVLSNPSISLDDAVANDLAVLFGAKYNHDPKDMMIKIAQLTDKHAYGSVKYKNDEQGAMFYASKIDDNWQIISSGNGAVTCALLTRYDFPVSMKNSCVAITEIENSTEIIDIKKLFVTKYKADIKNVNVTIWQEAPLHVRGGIKIGNAEEGGMFLAAKVNGVWTLVFDGNGALSCSAVSQYDFPSEMISDCVN